MRAWRGLAEGHHRQAGRRVLQDAAGQVERAQVGKAGEIVRGPRVVAESLRDVQPGREQGQHAADRIDAMQLAAVDARRIVAALAVHDQAAGRRRELRVAVALGRAMQVAEEQQPRSGAAGVPVGAPARRVEPERKADAGPVAARVVEAEDRAGAAVQHVVVAVDHGAVGDAVEDGVVGQPDRGRDAGLAQFAQVPRQQRAGTEVEQRVAPGCAHPRHRRVDGVDFGGRGRRMVAATHLAGGQNAVAERDQGVGQRVDDMGLEDAVEQRDLHRRP